MWAAACHQRFGDTALTIGHSMGGRPGERLASRLGMRIGRQTNLNDLQRAAPRPRTDAAAKAVGIDEWAWKKGTRYGTIIVDLERRGVLDVLARRAATSTAEWLRAHPGVEFVARDRDGVFAEGAWRGAPEARLVADRFHLLQNLRLPIERELNGIRDPVKRPGRIQRTGRRLRVPMAPRHQVRDPATGRRVRVAGRALSPTGAWTSWGGKRKFDSVSPQAISYRDGDLFRGCVTDPKTLCHKMDDHILGALFGGRPVRTAAKLIRSQHGLFS